MNSVTEQSTVPYLSLVGIDKYFGNTKALQEMDLEIRLGEVIGLVGPNGAGKSTLIKVITGVHDLTGGRIILDGKEVTGSSYNTNFAKAHGIACAYQELSLCTNLTVYENFMINHLNHKPFSKPGWRKEARQVTREYLDTAFPENGIDVNAMVGSLSLAQRQMVEISQAMSTKGIKILILDEPTSSLTADRIRQLHEAMHVLAEKGIAIIYITHKLDEIEKACQTVVVMKGGTTYWKGSMCDTSMNELVQILGGKIEVVHREALERADIPTIMNISGFHNARLHDISMSVGKGEIVGISGLAGSGQKDLLHEIFTASGKKFSKTNGIDVHVSTAYISGDRSAEGVFPLWDIADNTVISSLNQITHRGFIIREKFRVLAKFWYDKLKFIALGIHDNITNLSGGNQQKALLARGLASNAELLLLNDPTCGVDIETKQEIYRLLEEAKNQGKSILLHSTEDLEMEQCDRVYVMHDGSIVKELRGPEVTVSNIITISFEEKLKGSAANKRETDKSTGLPKRLLSSILSGRSTLAFLSLLIIFVLNLLANPKILARPSINIALMFDAAVPLVFVALGQMFMVIAGGIDLGNGQSLGLMNVIVAFTIVTNPALGVLFTVLFVIGYGALGILIHKTKIPPIVITLGASFVWLGLGLLVSPKPGGASPAWLSAFYNFNFPIIPMPIVISAVAALVAFWIVRKSKYGMIINGIGNNTAAVSRAGWSVPLAMFVAYALSGLFLAFGGLMLTAISSSGDVNASGSYCMRSFATVILGGCQFVGGIGSPVGVVAAALALTIIAPLLTFIGVDSNLQDAVWGLILIGALALNLFYSRFRAEAKK